MANRYFHWRGNGAGTKTDWQDGRNWVDGSGIPYSQTDYPGSSASDSDYVYFDAALEAGAASAETNLDLSAKNPIASLTMTSDYNGHVGTSTSILTVKIPNGEVIIDGSGCDAANYINGEGTTGINKIKTFGGSITIGGKIGSVELLKGVVEIANSATITTSLIIAYLTSPTTDVLLTIGSATLPSNVAAMGGTTTCNAALDSLDIRGGIWVQSGAITTVDVAGGTLDWRSGDIGTANVYSGTLTAANGSTARAIGTVTLYPAGTLNLNNRQSNISINNYIQTYGGSLVLGSGQKVTLV